jgi:hypothetical protein
MIMTSNRICYRAIAVAGGAGLITISALTAGCANNENQAPSTTTTTTTTTATTSPSSTQPPAAPTEKSLNPTGGNLFSPQVIAPPAPTEPPGVHRHRAG